MCFHFIGTHTHTHTQRMNTHFNQHTYTYITQREISVRASLMTPVKPMLAEACKSVEMAFKRCPDGMFAEIKYDGERVQIHKNGSDYQFFSRSLKHVTDHKVSFLSFLRFLFFLFFLFFFFVQEKIKQLLSNEQLFYCRSPSSRTLCTRPVLTARA